MKKSVGERKVRTDKKVDIKPTVPVQLYNCIADLSYVSNLPIKDIIEFFCQEGIHSKRVAEALAPRFRRDIWIDSTLFKGDPNLTHSRYLLMNTNSKRISARFTRDLYENISRLSYSLDYTISSATAILLEYSVRDINIIDKFLRTYTFGLDEMKQHVVNRILNYLYSKNPFREHTTIYDTLKWLFSKNHGKWNWGK